jgi:hypothetical protein
MGIARRVRKTSMSTYLINSNTPKYEPCKCTGGAMRGRYQNFDPDRI